MGSPGLDLRRTPCLWAVLAAAVGVGVGGCGGGSSRGPEISDATLADTTISAGVPDAFDAKARQAPDTFVGKIGPSGWAYVAVVVAGDQAVVYLCDGQVGEWFGAPVRGGRIRVRDRVGTVVDAVVHQDNVSGTVRPPRQPAGGFTAARPSAPGIGLFNGPDLSGSGHVRRWIVLPDGIRGVSDPPAADVVAGAGSATRQPAPATTTATTTTASPAASDVVAGAGTATRTTATTASPSASDVVAGSGAATRPTSTTSRSVATTTLTHSVSTTTTSTAPTTTRTATSQTTTAPGTISDGTSNTIIIGETTATSSLTSSSSLGDGSVRTLGGTTTATSSTAPGLTLVTSSSSTTVTRGAIVDGTSNTIAFGEATINGVAAGSTPPPTPPAPAVTNCVSTQPCPPPTPQLTSKVPTVTFGQSASGTPNIVAGGSLLDCTALAKLIAGLTVPAATGNAAARAQLTLLLAQAKANGC